MDKPIDDPNAPLTLETEAGQRIFSFWRRMLEGTQDDQRAIVPLFAKHGERLAHNRTGVLLAIGDAHFVVTAAHDMEEVAKGHIGLYLSPSRGQFAIPLSGRLVGAEPKIDVAVIELPSNTISELQPERRFLCMSDADWNADATPGAYVVRGYPEQLVRIDWSARNAAFKPMIYLAHVYEGDLPDGADERIHLLLQHGKKGHAMDGQVLRLPRIPGMSGGGIWKLCEFRRGVMISWQPSQAKLVGIQTHCKHGSYLKGTWIKYALDLIARHYPALGRVMKDMYL